MDLESQTNRAKGDVIRLLKTTAFIQILIMPLGCAVSLPEKTRVVAVVVADEEGFECASSKETEKNYQLVEDSNVQQIVDQESIEGTEYLFNCRFYDYERGWKQGKVNIFEKWKEPADSLLPMSLKNIDLMLKEARQKDEEKFTIIPGVQKPLRTNCEYQGVIFVNLQPVLQDGF